MGSSKKQTVGYKYYLSVHACFVHGPVDRIVELRFDDRVAYSGSWTDGEITIDQPNLFGGEAREGGVGGTIELCQGGPTQLQNSFLVDRCGPLVPAYRGVAGLLFKNFYWGNNPYFKTWAARTVRIHTRSDGSTQWYDAKAEVAGFFATSGTNFSETFSSGLSNYTAFAPPSTTGGGSLADFSVVTDTYGNAVHISAGPSNSHTAVKTPLAQAAPLQECHFKVKLVASGADDCGLIAFRDASLNTVFTFGIRRDSTVDSQRRPSVAFVDQPLNPGNPLGPSGGVPVGTWYQVDVTYDAATSVFNLVMTDLSTSTVYATTSITVAGRSNIAFVSFENDNFSGAGTSRFSDIQILTASTMGDMNPAHIIREALTDARWGMGYDEAADIDDVSFTAAADTLYAEGMGISLIWDQQMPIEDFIKEVLRHIDATLFVASRGAAAGKFVLKLIRNDYDVADLITLDESNVVSVEGWKQTQIGEMINSLTVNYWDPARSGTGSVTVSDPALVLQQGAVVNTTQHYEGFTNYSIASRAAERDLRGLSAPLYSGSITALWDPANELEIGDPFVFSFPDLEIASVVLRVTAMSRGDGRDHNVRLTVAQDVFSLPTQPLTAEPTTDWTDPTDVVATPATDRVAMELPYRELVQLAGQSSVDSQLSTAPDAGFVGAAAARPAGALHAELWTDAGAGYAQAGVVDFCPSAELAASIGYTDTTLALTNAKGISEVEPGTAALIGTEWVIVTSVTATSLVCERGTIDTVPQTHAAGTRVYFLDNYTERDPTQYADGETVGVKLLPVTGVNKLPIGSATADNVTLASRAARPYPPGKLRIDGVAVPSAVAGTFGVTWEHRDRTLQADQLLGTEASGVGPESGVRYGLRFEDASTAALIIERTDLGTNTATVQLGASAPASVRLKLWAITDAGDSWQTHERVFSFSGGAGSPSIDGIEYVPSAGDVVIIDGNDPPPTSVSTGPSVADGGKATTGTPRTLTIGATVIDPCASPYNASPSASAATNSAAFNSAFGALPVGGGTVQPSVLGDYTFDTANPVKPVSHSRLKFPAGCRMVAAGTTFVTSPSAGRHLVVLDGVTHVEVQAARATGYRTYWAANGGRAAFGASEWSHWLFITNGSTEINVQPSTAVDFVGDAISIGRSCSNIWIGGLVTRNNRRQGVSNGGDFVTMSDCDIGYIGGSDGTAPMAGVDNEVDNPTSYSSTNMVMERCRVHHCSGPGVNLYKSANNVTLTDLVSEYNQRGVVGLDSDNVTINGSATALRYNRYEGLYVSGSCSTWSVRAALYYNKTTQYPNQTGTGTTAAPSSTLKSKNAYVASTVSGLSYASGTTWGPV